MRFHHEADEIKLRGGILIRVDRTQHRDHSDNHISETECSSIIPDYIIINNDTLEKLYSNIDKIFTS